MSTSLGPRKVLLLEFNEITRAIIDPMVAKGLLPTFARLFEEGTWAAPESVDHPPHLDPWVTWVTVHTGVDRSVHGATVLEQDVCTVTSKRTWEYAALAGKSIGIFGSIGAHPPRPAPGFIVPGPFAPTSDTWPAYAEPIQALNRKYTQVHHRGDASSIVDMVRESAALLRLGLRPATIGRVGLELLRERFAPHERWRRVSAQPLVNYDFFAMLYRRYQPDYATWHTNHAAHYMHHYWRAMDDAAFLARSSAEERRKFGRVVEHGYQICDELLARFLALKEKNTVLVLASSMGQKPYVADLFPEGRIVVRLKDVHRLLAIVGGDGVTEVVPTMVPQWNVRVPNADKRARMRALLERAEARGGTRPNAFAVAETGEIITFSPLGHARIEPGLRVHFPGAPGDRAGGYAFEELFVADAPTPKEGMHHPTGLLAFHGEGIRRGATIEGATNLDIAPTILALLGIEKPPSMLGHVLPIAANAGGPTHTPPKRVLPNEPLA